MITRRFIAARRPEQTQAGTFVRRALPANLDPFDIHLFFHHLEKVIPPTELVELDHIKASADGFLFRGGRIVLQSFAVPQRHGQWRTREVAAFFARNYLLRRRRRIERPVAWIVHDWCTAYFHWLADALTRLLAVRDRLDGDVSLLLPEAYRRLPFVEPSLAAFDVPHVEYIGDHEVAVCERMLFPTCTAPPGHYNESAVRSVRDVLLRRYGAPSRASAGSRLYISRAGARRRRIVNESEVVRVLEGFDFQVIRAEDHSFVEQVRLASEARYLVSNHGSGLTNMLFMPPRSSVLELRHCADRINQCFFTLASALEHRYFYQACAPDQPDADVHTTDLRVDVNRLADNVWLMLNAPR